jgi:6-phosphogluconate dehydrogenase
MIWTLLNAHVSILGFTVACFNRTVAKVDEFLEGRAKGKSIIGAK